MSSIAATTNSTGTSSTSSTSGSSNASATSGAVTSTGIGSGLDITDIVSSLTTAYGAAQTSQLDAQQQSLDSQVSAYGTFTSALDSLQAAVQEIESPSQIEGFSGTVADTSIASATTDATAVAGSYSLQVDHLATAASLTSRAFATASTAVGTGTLTITSGGKASVINIGSSDNTVAGIAAAINSASDNPGVTASIISTTDGARLVISGTATGAANAITVTQTGGDGGLSALQYDPANNHTNLTQSQAAFDASFSINGYSSTSASNVVSNAITGVTLNLLSTSAADTPTTVTVAPDSTNATKGVGDFITALNSTISAIQGLTSYDPTTEVAGALNGNATLEAFQNQLQSILGTIKNSSTSTVRSLSDIGITSNTDGSYTSDATKLSNALTGNLSGVLNLLTGKTGIATQIDTLINSYTGTGGLISSINSGLNNQLKSVAQQQASLKTQLATYSATLTTEYNAMDTAVAKLKEMQQYLNAEFNNNSSSSSSSTSSLSSGTTSA